MSEVSGRNKTLVVLIVLAALAVALLGYRVRILATLEELWGVREVRELSHDAVDTVVPLDMGPTREMTSRWASSRPDLDGVLSSGEWEGAVVAAFDGTDRIRPGVASSHKDSIRDRKSSGLIPYSSNHAVLYLMNDDSSVYVAIDVFDDVLDFADGDVARRDSVEVALCDARSRQFFLFRGDGEVYIGGLPAGAYAAAVKPDSSGYVVEIAWESPVEDQVIGFDVGINDSDDPADENERNQYFWNGTHDSWMVEGRECGRVRLTPGSSRR